MQRIRVVPIPAALESVEDAVVLVERAESASQVVVHRVDLHRPGLHVDVPYLERHSTEGQCVNAIEDISYPTRIRVQMKGREPEWPNPQNWIYPPPNLEILLKCVSGAAQDFQIFGHMLVWDAHFSLHFCAIHAISSTSFWVGPLWFSALQIIRCLFSI